MKKKKNLKTYDNLLKLWPKWPPLLLNIHRKPHLELKKHYLVNTQWSCVQVQWMHTTMQRNKLTSTSLKAELEKVKPS